MVELIHPGKNGHSPDQKQKLTRPLHIFIGVSTHDHRCHSRFTSSLFGLAGRQSGYKFSLFNTSSGGIHKARNHLMHVFLNHSDADLYWSLDSDISFLPEHLDRLVSHLMEGRADIVGAPYSHKKPELEWSARGMQDMKPNGNGLMEVNAAGTGFLLMKRNVPLTMRDKFPHLMHKEDWSEGRGEEKYDLFWEGIMTDPQYYPDPTFLTEDWGFCYHARKAGFKIMLDTSFFVMHWEGGRGYPEKEPERKVSSGLEMMEARYNR